MKDIDAEIQRLCVALTLDPYYERQCGKLSGGNRRKLMLATALIGAVEVVFLDEPSTGVDPFARKCMKDVIKQCSKDRAVVLTTHIMEEVNGLCERVGIMVNGDFKSVNTINNLVNETNEGYQLEVSIATLNDATVLKVQNYIHKQLKGVVLTEKDASSMAYQIPTQYNPLSSIFTVAQKIAVDYEIEYVVSQMTMDQ
eukprot:UN30989